MDERLLIENVYAKIDKRMSILKAEDDFMEKLEPVFCPIHGKKLMIEQETVLIDGKYTSLVVGRCPECQIRYIGKKKRLTKTGKKGSFIYDGKIYEYTPRMQQIELSINKGELPVKYPEPEEQIKQTEETSESLKDKGTAKTELELPRQIYVVSNLDFKKCPVCDRKTTFTPKKLLLKNGNQTSVMGYECFKCNVPFILEKVAEEYFLEDYIDELNLDFLEVNRPKKKKIAEPKKDVAETQKKKAIRELHNITFFVTTQLTNCMIHNCKLKKYKLMLVDEKSQRKRPIGGYYCKKCGRIYIHHRMEIAIMETFGENAVNLHTLKMICIGKEWEGMPMIPVIKIESDLDKKEEAKEDLAIKNNLYVSLLDDAIQRRKESAVKELPEEKKFKTEIAVISATYNKEEVLIHVVKRLEKGENTAGKPDEICVRSLSLLGRELLGRIAHEELVEFSTEKETVKIHQFKVWPDEEYNLYGFKKFTDVDKVQTITILNQKNLPSGSDDYETVTALVYCAGRDLPVYIDVYYSKLNDEYFINSDSYELYTRRYGLPYVRIISDEYGGNFGYDDLRQQSELSLYGYSVGKNAGLTSADRQRLLQQLLDNHFMTKSQIINHLEWLINTHKYRESMRDACDCWKEDLMYVHQCKINTQRAFWGKFAYKGTVLK